MMEFAGWKSLTTVTAALAVTACATTSGDSPATSLTGAKYVAMGSSFAAGAGIGPLQEGTPKRCGRTTNNYANLLANRLHLQLVDVSCGGATTANVLHDWSELPAQINALGSDTRLVTVTIGGNDVGYALGLLGASCRAGAPFRPGPCFPKAEATQEAWDSLERNLHEISRQVSERAPRAKLIFVQYMTLVPDALCSATAISASEATEFRALGKRLAEVTERVARSNGAIVISMDRLSHDHTACSAAPWSHGMFAGYDVKQGSPWHPNKDGHAAVAEALVGVLKPYHRSIGRSVRPTRQVQPCHVRQCRSIEFK